MFVLSKLKKYTIFLNYINMWALGMITARKGYFVQVCDSTKVEPTCKS